MKKIFITLGLIAIIIFASVASINYGGDKNEYLRIHIRANSNNEQDLSIKYSVKELTVNYLTPIVCECESKQQLIDALLYYERDLENEIDSFLYSQGYNYKSNVYIDREKFPTRVYDDLTLDSGYYDAVIIELGLAKGDNWWCVVYPPLCFSGNESGIEYKSKIQEIISNFKSCL